MHIEKELKMVLIKTIVYRPGHRDSGKKTINYYLEWNIRLAGNAPKQDVKFFDPTIPFSILSCLEPLETHICPI